MRKALLIFTAALSLYAQDTWAEKDFKTFQEYTYGKAVSPSGQYIVGCDPRYNVDNSYSVSYLYDMNTGEMSWLTEFDENDFSKGGDFSAVTDNGVICGSTKDPDLLITYTDMFGTVTRPANSAAVWKDGEKTLLYYGDFDTSKFLNLGDGSQATGISADGKTVIGFVAYENFASVKSCKWTQTETGEWTHEWLPLPENITNAKASYISTDGRTIIGMANDTSFASYVVIWKDGECQLVGSSEIDGNPMSALILLNASANGKYVLVSNRSSNIYMYDTESGTSRMIPNFDSNAGVESAAVDNNGNIVAAFNYGSVFFGGEAYTRPFWYSNEDNRIFDLTYYMDLFAEGVEPDFAFSYEEKTQALPSAISADGSVFMGNVDVYLFLEQKPRNWFLRSERYDVSIPQTPEGLKAFSDKVGQVNLSWEKDQTVYDDLTLVSYTIYRDGEKTGEVMADQPAAFTQENVPSGHPKYQIEAVFQTKDGATIVSPKSNTLKVSLPENYDMPLYEDFSSNTFDTNYWETEIDYGTDASWPILQDYGLIGSSITSMVLSGEPYSGSFVSRPLDATGKSNVYFSFLGQFGLVDYTAEQPLDQDSVSVEVSTDFGQTWTVAKTWTIGELLVASSWNIFTTDLSDEVAGKVFKLRMRKHGLCKAPYTSMVDNVKIYSETDGMAPTGLVGEFDEENNVVSLMWHNRSGAYNLNHIYSPSLFSKYAIGNEGKELIAANMFDAADLKQFKGKYLTGVTTTFNYYYDPTAGKELKASVVVFKDGKMIREQEIEDMQYGVSFTTVLNEPVEIDDTEDLRIGIKITDYDAAQLPLCYIISESFIAGKSDLYSEDNGETWMKVSEFYEQQGNPTSGYCSWEITGCITDGTELNPADETNLLAYNIYRNGEQLNSSIIDRLQARFTDNQPLDEACYKVEAHYIDGAISDFSEEICISKIGVEEEIADGISIRYTPGESYITIENSFDNAMLINLNGTVVSRSQGNIIPLAGVANGIYLLRVEAGGEVFVRKMIVTF